jgi:hypothetical protein
LDSDAFRNLYRDVNERACVYEKAILTNECACSEAHKFCIAEREGVRCGSDEAHLTCLELLETLRTQSRFALKSLGRDQALPHAKAMRLKVGGLKGIALALDPDQPAPARIADVRGLILTALARFGDLSQLPFPVIMQQIAAYRGRPRRRGARDDGRPA